MHLSGLTRIHIFLCSSLRRARTAFKKLRKAQDNLQQCTRSSAGQSAPLRRARTAFKKLRKAQDNLQQCTRSSAGQSAPLRRVRSKVQILSGVPFPNKINEINNSLDSLIVIFRCNQHLTDQIQTYYRGHCFFQSLYTLSITCDQKVTIWCPSLQLCGADR